MAHKYPTQYADRRKDLAIIHMAAVQLGMDTTDQNPDSAYRSMLWTVARVRSSAALDWAGRKKVLDHLKACGYKPTSNHAGKPANVKPELMPLMSKIGALLADMKLPWAYAAAIAKKQTSSQGKGIDRLEWLDAKQLHAVVTALVKRKNALSLRCAPPSPQGRGVGGEG
ncbi:MAG: regulatory protein GemA [Gallionellaceae bacterium]|nr:regulatory protein GemA [Gallionellaceae bacterium]